MTQDRPLALTRERSCCPGCEGIEERPLFIKAGFRFVECRRCRLIYVSNILVNNFHASENYHSPKEGEESRNLETRGDKFGRAQRILSEARHYFRGKTDISILDIGCGNGFFLRFLRENGYPKLRGLDPNPNSVRFINEKIGIYADQGFVENCDYEDKAFDLLVMDQILEHVESPNRVLQACQRILKPGGLLWISTPNVKSWHILLRLKQYHRHFNGRVHLNHFTPKTLRDILVRNGFHVRDVVTHIEEATLGRLKSVFFHPEDFDVPFFREVRGEAGVYRKGSAGDRAPRRPSYRKRLALPLDWVLIHTTRLLKLGTYVEITATR